MMGNISYSPKKLLASDFRDGHSVCVTEENCNDSVNMILSPKLMSDSERTKAPKSSSYASQNSAKSSKMNSVQSIFSDSDSNNDIKSIFVESDNKIMIKPIVVRQSITHRQKSCSVNIC